MGYNYPEGAAEDPMAPYNRETTTIPIMVSIVMSKDIEIEVEKGYEYTAEDLTKIYLETDDTLNKLEKNKWYINNLTVLEDK